MTFVTAALASIVVWPGAASAASCSGQSHDVALTSGAASPGSGTTATAFQFSVTYADNAGCAPTAIMVVIAGAGTFPLTFKSGDLTTGATFARALTLPAGTHAYSFEAVSGSGPGELAVKLTAVNPGAVTVISPAPKPDPTPARTEPPPPPTPGATPTPAASATPASTATGSPTAGATSGAGGVIDPNASGPPGGPPGAAHTLFAGPPGSRSTGASQLIEPVAVAAAPLPEAIAGGGPGPLEELAVAALGTIVGLGLFMLLGVRLLGTGLALRPMSLTAARVPSIVSAARAANAATEALFDVRPAPDLVAGTIAPAVDEDVAGPLFVAREPMRFDAPPAEGIDRCRVLSRLVALRREPDELSWPHPDRLDVGDEVDVLRQDGPYCYVRTPRGIEGWVPGLTLSGAKAPDPVTGADDGR